MLTSVGVHAIVERDEGGMVPARGDARLLLQLASQLTGVRGGDALRGERHGAAFHGLAEELHVCHVLDVDRRHGGAHLRPNGQQSLVLEADDRLAHRGAAYAEALRDLVLRQRLAGAQMAREDRLAQPCESRGRGAARAGAALFRGRDLRVGHLAC